MPAADESFIQRGGELGALMRAHDWASTPLGPLGQWPQSLRTSLSTMLRSPYPIILFWGPQRVMLYNDPFRPILGTKHPLALGSPGATTLAEEWAQLGPLMDGVLKTGEPVFIENGNVNFERRPGGLREEAYFTWSYNPTIGEDGQIAGLFAIASETTRQVVGERQLGLLRELSIRTAAARREADIVTALHDVLEQGSRDVPFSLFYEVNAEGAKLASVTGLTAGARAAPERAPLDDTTWPFASLAEGGKEQLLEHLDTRVGPLPGRPWPESATRAFALPVPMGGGRSGVLIAGLSPLRSFDDEYRGFLQLLARQLAASISSARAYAQEKQRAEELARLDHAKTAFFSNVSHELRTPLTLILGPIEDAKNEGRALAGEPLELVRRNALRLYKMVNTLLDFSRTESGRAQASFAPTDLPALTRNLASAFDSAAQSAGLKLVVDCPPLPEPVWVDPELWEKVVLNLLSNAVKYTHTGEVVVRLSWSEGGPVLTVQDTGVGIPQAELPRVFERFYRVRSTEGRSHEGTGIGLALVQELVKQHGGQVSVESTPGKGTTFTVKLQRGHAHLPEAKVEQHPRAASQGTAAALYVEEARRWSSVDAPLAGPAAPPLELAEPLRSSRILLVDDNADLRQYVAGALKTLFPNVETANDGLQALERVRAQRPDLVLSDVMMPRLDGIGLVRELRGDPKTRAIPVILLSARAGDEPTVEGLSSGADDYLVKPFSVRELLARVRTQLQMVAVRRELTRAELTAEQLRESVQTRDEFLNLVGHELRTPVSALQLNVHSLVKAVPQQISARAEKAERQLSRLTRLVEQLIAVSEFVTGGLALVRQEVELTGVVTEVVERVRDAAARANSPVTFRATGGLKVGKFDKKRLSQLVEALIDNALKFGVDSPIELELSEAPGRATLKVVDHGIGVDAGASGRVFERYERAVSSDHYGGFGLGLWLARHIAEGHGGTVQLSQTPGGGATFEVMLPLSGPQRS